MCTVSRETCNKRLEILAAFLDRLDPSRFDFARIVDHDNVVIEGAEVRCNTTACAVGWMPTIPEFKALGVTLMKVDSGRDGRDGLYTVGYTVGMTGRNPPKTPNKGLEEVCYSVFGLNKYKARYLFFPDYLLGDTYNNLTEEAMPGTVAAHIRRVIKDGFPDEIEATEYL